MSALKVLDIFEVVVFCTSGRLRPELVVTSGALAESATSLAALLFLDGGGSGSDSSSELDESAPEITRKK